jgi:uncharacterized protein
MKILANGTAGENGPVIACKPELVRFDHRGVRFAFDPNSLKLAVLDNEDEKDLADFSIPLKPNYILQPAACPGTICIDTTRACNLRCTYCFASTDGERTKAVNLSFEDTVDALSLLLPKAMRGGAMAKRRLEISFFGGEPLTRFDLIEKVVNHVKTWVPCQHHFHVTTNGTLITKEIAKFLSLHGFSTIVSVDGTQEAHDKCRLRQDGTGSYEYVMRGLELLKKYAPNVIKSTTLRSTFTPDSVAQESIATRLAHLNDLVEKGYGSYVSIEPAFLGENTCNDRSLLAEQAADYTKFQEVWEERYNEVADLWLERLAADKKVYFHHFISYARRLVNSMGSPSECGAGRGYYTIAPGGEIYACHHEGGTRIGSIHTGGVDHELSAPWDDNRYYARLKCPTCPWRNICGGGCREYSVAQGLGVSMPVPNECEFKSLLMKQNAWLIYKALTDESLRDKALAYWSTGSQRRKCTPAGDKDC